MYSNIVVPRGTILYSGGRYDMCIDKYKYIGQAGHKSDGKIMYLSPNENTAFGYAVGSLGIVKKYVVMEDLILKDITENMAHFEYDQLEPFCKDADGYFLDWGMEGNMEHVEVAICDVSKKIKYEECKTQKDFKLNRPYSYECANFCAAEVEKIGGKSRRKMGRKRRTRKFNLFGF
jgi:hypothetical protein